MQNTLSKSERLKKRDDIKQLFEKGESIFEYPFKLYHIAKKQDQEASPLLFGISVPKKKFKRAVDRNLIKRRSKEAYRIHQHNLKKLMQERGESLLIMPVYIADEILNYKEVEDKIILLLQRLLRIYEQDH